MKVIIKFLFLSLLIGSSYPTQAADDDEDMKAAMAASLGLTLNEYRNSLSAECAYPKNNCFPDTSSDEALARLLSLEGETWSKTTYSLNFFEKQEQENLDRTMAMALQNQLTPAVGMISQANIDKILSGPPEAAQQFCNFKEIINHLKTIPNDSDVHILDPYIYNNLPNITKLLQVGRCLGIDLGTLSWVESQNKLTAMFPGADADWVSDYGPHKITVGMVKGHIATYFANLPAQLGGLCEPVRELWSRTISLAEKLAPDDPAVRAILAQSICENYLTQGGCIQGRVNRVFVLYASFMNATGINDAIEIIEALRAK